jgi:putative spermidine/putrescine transport system substrate-binding protein
VVLVVTACSSTSTGSGSDQTTAASSPAGADDPSNGAVEAATATSVADFGGMDGLIAAAKEEGELNVIALPPNWANYGEVISTFEQTYGVKVNSAQPEGSSQDEINAVNQLRGTPQAPDVLDLGMAVALVNTDLFAPYQVTTWEDIPAAQKEPTGLWVQDYGGYMAIGYDSATVPEPTSVADLLKPAYRGKIAINGDPTQANAALTAVMMASVATGGSLDDVTKGIDFFRQLKQAGNLLPLQASPATIANGTTQVVFDWDYLSLASARQVRTWKVFLPPNAIIGGYYAQAINKDAPHPAAARLWQEFLFSDEGQNLWLKGGARPVRLEKMTAAGTADTAAYELLPKVDGTALFLNEAQATKAKQILATEWAKAIS